MLQVGQTGLAEQVVVVFPMVDGDQGDGMGAAEGGGGDDE